MCLVIERFSSLAKLQKAPWREPKTKMFSTQIDAYNRLLDEVTQLLSDIHTTYTSPDAPQQINIPYNLTKQVTGDIKQSTNHIIPSLETVFTGAQEHVERLLAGDIYPRFVRHQVTASATMALADHRERYPGLGDCFCLTDPT
jgi:phototropin